MKENTPPLTLQNHYSKQTNHPTLIGVFLMEMPTKRERAGGASLRNQNFELHHSAEYCLHQKIEFPGPSAYYRPYIVKEGISNSF